MEDILKNMDEDKRKRVINSALEEFSVNTFKKASTNNIVKNAGISKGLLYHYFSTKQALYDYLMFFVFTVVIDEIKVKLDWNDGDLFNRLKQVVLLKMGVAKEYPYLMEFGKKIYEQGSVDDMKKKLEEYEPDIYNEIYTKNIDYSKFRDGLDINRAIFITESTLTALAEKMIKVANIQGAKIDFSMVVAESEQYLNILKSAFYK